MKEISKHCSDLSKLISGFVPDIEWLNQYDLLNIASGIVNVEFDVIRYDICFGYCNRADEFHGALEKILKKYITELTRFTYVWGALESLIDDINSPPAPARGKINSICYYLKNKLPSDEIIRPYSKLVKRLKHILENTDVKEDDILKRFDGAEYISEHGIGLYVIYKLRNLFVHGSINFPMPDEENRPISMYPEMVHISTRIVLLTIQMIWLAYYLESDVQSTRHWEQYIYKSDEHSIKKILHKIHLRNPEYSKSYNTRKQLKFDWK